MAAQEPAGTRAGFITAALFIFHHDIYTVHFKLLLKLSLNSASSEFQGFYTMCFYVLVVFCTGFWCFYLFIFLLLS